MQFYKASCAVSNPEWGGISDEAKQKREALTEEIYEKTELFNEARKDAAFVCAAKLDRNGVKLAAFVKKPLDEADLMREYLDALGFRAEPFVPREITFREAKRYLSLASNNDYIDSDDNVLEALGLNELDGWRSGVEHEECLFALRSREEIYQAAAELLSEKTLIPELDRIYQSSCSAVRGHPVHYLVLGDDPKIREKLIESLLNALYAQGRIRSRRYVTIEREPGSKPSQKKNNILFESCGGGTIVVNYRPNDERDDCFAGSDCETIEAMCRSIRKYSDKTLTILCLPRDSVKTKNRFIEALGNVSMVELKEDPAGFTRSREYLKAKAREEGLAPDRRLYAKLDRNNACTATDLNRYFDEWFKGKLRSSVYPQYKKFAPAVGVAVKQKAEGNAYDELQEMVGLGSAKSVIGEALAYYKAQRLYAERGMKVGRAAMHMVFTGNPGTAKTTVARLFARIMRDNGLLSGGQLVEVGRSDLVGKYVGWTAPTVKKAFKEAEGGVLFIDEAYSLVDDRDGLYGDEAINTIVQEMENHREDMVVIFAGYPDKMEGFLQKNPGLRSRIAFNVPFEDYSAEDLLAITRLLAGRKKLELTVEAMGKLSGIYGAVLDQKDFGNGRFVRNVLEKAQMAQARRLLTMDPEAVTDRDVRTIEAADIEEPPMNRQREEKRKIGF